MIYALIKEEFEKTIKDGPGHTSIATIDADFYEEAKSENLQIVYLTKNLDKINEILSQKEPEIVGFYKSSDFTNTIVFTSYEVITYDDNMNEIDIKPIFGFECWCSTLYGHNKITNYYRLD